MLKGSFGTNCNFNSEVSSLEVSRADRNLHYSVQFDVVTVQEYPDYRVTVSGKGLSNLSGRLCTMAL